MSELYIALTVVGVAILLLALVSRPIEETPLSPTLLMMLLGIVLGPSALDVLDPSGWGDPHAIMEEAARLTLAIAVMGVALRLPRGYVLRQWRILAVLLLLVMPLSWLITGLLAYWILGVPLLAALLLGAIMTPTDPVVSSSIVTGSVSERNLPARIRNALSAESGSNDGLAYPLVILPILLLTAPAGAALGEWLGRTLLLEIGGGIVLGILLGVLAGACLRYAEARNSLEQSSFLAYTLALSLFGLGLARLVQVDEIITVFVAGLAFDQLVGARERAQEENVQEAVNSFFTLPAFALFGLLLPWDEWYALGWQGVALALAVLLLRRLPAVLLVYRLMPGMSLRDACFMGWFGPLGLAALLYATLAIERTGEADSIWAVSSLLVFASVLIHGLTASPLTKRFGRHRRRTVLPPRR